VSAQQVARGCKLIHSAISSLGGGFLSMTQKPVVQLCRTKGTAAPEGGGSLGDRVGHQVNVNNSRVSACSSKVVVPRSNNSWSGDVSHKES
jgi:hypothetical protein